MKNPLFGGLLSGSSAEEFLDSIIENIPNMIFVKEAQELRFVRFNQAGEELLGYSRQELIGKNDYDFFPKEEADFFVSRDRAVLESGKPLDIPEEPIHTRHKGRSPWS
jgi:PAS domain S-box-containing protein